MALLEIRNVTRRFGSMVAVDGVSLSINAGEFFTLLGPSGCGKTTLLRMIAGFDAPDGGSIALDGRDLTGVAPEHRPVRTVFQSYALFPHMTVAGNIAFPLKMARTPAAEIAPRVNEALKDVQLSAFAQRLPNELSGGQKQRVAIARALVTRPQLMLLDEPLAALDAKLREQLQLELINLQKEVGITFVYVTHDQSEALALSHRIAVMNHGRVEQLDEPSRIYSFPASRFVADFIGQCNVLDGSVVSRDGPLCAVQLDGIGAVHAVANTEAMQKGSRGALALRPEKVFIRAAATDAAPTGAASTGAAAALDGDHHAAEPAAAQAANQVSGKITDFLYLGDVTLYIVELASGKKLEAMRANSASGRTRFFEVGDAVKVSWRVDAGHFLVEP